MAVLSACNTGYGKLIKGEGIMSLARAFSYAGCPSVVMSHWQVDDKSTSELMELFYKELSEGKAKDEALRLAKLEYLKHSNITTSHPFYWSSFVVIGSTNPITETRNNSWSIIVIIVMLLLGISIYLLKKKKIN